MRELKNARLVQLEQAALQDFKLPDQKGPAKAGPIFFTSSATTAAISNA
jgi:hypothetical protein